MAKAAAERRAGKTQQRTNIDAGGQRALNAACMARAIGQRALTSPLFFTSEFEQRMARFGRFQ